MNETKTELTKEQRVKMRALIRKAIIAQCVRWDAERAIELILDREISGSEDLIKETAVSIDDARAMNDADLDDVISEYLELENNEI